MAALVQILAGLGVVTVLLAITKLTTERRRWKLYKRLIEGWIDRIRDEEDMHPKDLSAVEWKARCQRLLTDAKFSPLEIQQLLDTAVIVAKGIVSDKFFICLGLIGVLQTMDAHGSLQEVRRRSNKSLYSRVSCLERPDLGSAAQSPTPAPQ